MFKHTRQAINKIGKDIKFIKWIFSYGFNILMIAYLVFALCVSLGNTMVNAILLVLTVLFFVFSGVYSKKELSKKEQKLQKEKLCKVKRAIRISKLVARTYSLGLVFYCMYFATVTPSPISIILTTLSLFCWVASVVMEILIFIFEKEKELFFGGLEKDFEWVINAKDFAGQTISQVKEKAEDIKDGIVGFFKRDNQKINKK